MCLLWFLHEKESSILAVLKLDECLSVRLQFELPVQVLKPLQNKKGQKNLGYPRKKFFLIKGLLFSRAALVQLLLELEAFLLDQNVNELELELHI